MMEITGIRQRAAALAGAALLLCGNISLAQTAQDRPAKSPAPTSVAGQSDADAAAYEKLKSGQVDEAAAAFQAALAAKPDDPGALLGMGQVRMLQGNYLAAISFLERARQSSPNDGTIAAALDSARFQFLMGEGKDAATAKDNEDAEKRYREALELEPDSPPAVSALVNVLVMENKLSDAQDALSSAIARGAAATGHPPAELEMQLGQLDIAGNQPELAYPIFLQVLQNSPQRVDAWSGLISSLHLMGHDADAVAQEKVIPAETRAQLEATPGFGDMMATMANASALPAAGQAYAPFVPGPAAQSLPAAVAPQPTTPPSAATPSARAAAERPEVEPAPATGHLSPRQSAPRPAPAVASSAKAAPSSSAQTGRIPAPGAQTDASSRSASSTGAGAALVSQPAKRPAQREEVPDTGDQQYPQPKMRPRQPSSGSAPATPSVQN